MEKFVNKPISFKELERNPAGYTRRDCSRRWITTWSTMKVGPSLVFHVLENPPGEVKVGLQYNNDYRVSLLGELDPSKHRGPRIRALFARAAGQYDLHRIDPGLSHIRALRSARGGPGMGSGTLVFSRTGNGREDTTRSASAPGWGCRVCSAVGAVSSSGTRLEHARILYAMPVQ